MRTMKSYKNILIRAFGAHSKRNFSSVTNEHARKFRNAVFEEEKLRQKGLVPRIEKIEVKYQGKPSPCTLVMNRNISTPYDCAKHMQEVLCTYSVVASVNGKLWDMHRPLTEDCEISFLNFKSLETEAVNKVFWRSCSFLLGYVIERAFQDDLFIELHSWPKPNVRSGSYVYDANIKIPDWKPTAEELRTLTVMLWKLGTQNYVFERLNVSESVAVQMFEHNRYKMLQIPNIAKSSPEKCVTVYRVNDHIDISYGPMMGSTKFLGSTQVTAVHKLDNEFIYRFQGLSIPKQLSLNSYAFSVLVQRAKKLNTIGLVSADTDCETSEASEEMNEVRVA